MTKKETVHQRLSELPDYAALKKLAAALWQEENAYHGAAVMVGAGFSRTAASTGDHRNRLPLWNNLSQILEKELGGIHIPDPLRLAEEYSAFFGKQALHDLVKKEINDAAWLPGELHKRLLELPWSEVLTTNWDTLLERASKDVHSPVYNVVCKQEDLSSAPSPRIVKLHGTVNVTENLVFTQEDYRKYPERHAAFVNLARQVFIENELCLVGFSGDDPNFLQWAGWVRDHLALHARRIYLVGALNLTAAKRKYLESINVAPIDLGHLVGEYDDHDVKHAEATSIFLQALLSLKPNPAWDWSPSKLIQTSPASEDIENPTDNLDREAMLLVRMLPGLQATRESYPGWLVCPEGPRRELEAQLNNPFPRPDNLAKMEPGCRVKLLYEIAWRHSVTFAALAPWLTQELLAICDPAKPNTLTKRQQMEVALLLLKNTRWMGDAEANSIEWQTTSILSANEKYWPESASEFAFHQAVVARDMFDYSTLETLIEKISVRDPVWKLKKASLLAELGRFDEGEVLIEEAHRELLLYHRNDRNSIYVLSRLAWAQWMLNAVGIWQGKTFESLPSSYQISKCNPWDHIDHLRKRIAKELDMQQQRQEIQPSFEPGSYVDNRQTRTFSGALHPFLLLEEMACSVGIPFRWRSVIFLVEQASRLVELQEVDGWNRFSLALRAANSDSSGVLKSVFSRINVACLPEGEANKLLECCKQAIDYWSSKYLQASESERNFAIDRLRVFIEVLARVAVRATPEQAKQLFSLACRLGDISKFRHPWLFDALRHLIEYSQSSIPESEHQELLWAALSFPLSREANLSGNYGWPNPVIEFPGKRHPNAALDRRIDAIIDDILPCRTESSSALLRLLPLLQNAFLTDQERMKIAEKVWGASPDDLTLPETGLLKWTLLKLPAKDPAEVRRLVRRYLFEAEGNSLFDTTLLQDIVNIAQVEQNQELPSENEASNYFDRLVAWRPNHIDRDSFWVPDQLPTANLIGKVLSYSIVPALPVQSLTEENFQKLQDFYIHAESPSAIVALPIFAIYDSVFCDRVAKFVRQGLQGRDPKKIANASFALLKWRQSTSSATIERLILRLVSLVGSIRMAGLPALLWAVRQMYASDYLTRDQIESLIEILPGIFDYATYSEAAISKHDTVSVSLVRAECVKLARDILNKSGCKYAELLQLVENAKHDALPEVRFAENVRN